MAYGGANSWRRPGCEKRNVPMVMAKSRNGYNENQQSAAGVSWRRRRQRMKKA